VLGYKPRLPCPRHGYPGYKPGALVTNLGSWLQTKTPMPQAWLPWLQTRGPWVFNCYKPRLPCPRHGYPGYKPGALVTNLGSSTAWLQTKTPMPQAWVPWLQTRGPGYKPRVFNCLVTNQDSHAPGMGTLVTNQGPWLQT
jgi:hypothetical protein